MSNNTNQSSDVLANAIAAAHARKLAKANGTAPADVVVKAPSQNEDNAEIAEAKIAEAAKIAAEKAEKEALRAAEKAERDALRASNKARREAERTEKLAAREAVKAEKKTAREEKKASKVETPVHMTKVAKAAAKLPVLEEATQSILDNVVTELSLPQQSALASHISMNVRIKSTENATTVKVELKEGDKVEVVNGDAKFIGLTGVVTEARRIRCLIAVEGHNKPLYLFTSDVEKLAE